MNSEIEKWRSLLFQIENFKLQNKHLDLFHELSFKKGYKTRLKFIWGNFDFMGDIASSIYAINDVPFEYLKSHTHLQVGNHCIFVLHPQITIIIHLDSTPKPYFFTLLDLQGQILFNDLWIKNSELHDA